MVGSGLSPGPTPLPGLAAASTAAPERGCAGILRSRPWSPRRGFAARSVRAGPRGRLDPPEGSRDRSGAGAGVQPGRRRGSATERASACTGREAAAAAGGRARAPRRRGLPYPRRDADCRGAGRIGVCAKGGGVRANGAQWGAGQATRLEEAAGRIAPAHEGTSPGQLTVRGSPPQRSAWVAEGTTLRTAECGSQ